MAYELFTRKRRVYPAQALVAITKAGSLNFNTRASEEFLKGVNHVTLFFDRQRRLIGLKSAKVKSGDSYPVKRFGARAVAQVTAIGFVKYFGINYS